MMAINDFGTSEYLSYKPSTCIFYILLMSMNEHFTAIELFMRSNSELFVSTGALVDHLQG